MTGFNRLDKQCRRNRIKRIVKISNTRSVLRKSKSIDGVQSNYPIFRPACSMLDSCSTQSFCFRPRS